MLGSPCSPCCGFDPCAVDLSSLVQSVEVDISASDYFSEWIGSVAPSFQQTAGHSEFHITAGFKGSRFDGKFSLQYAGTRQTLAGPISTWQYLISDTPQFCVIQGGGGFAEWIPGIFVELPNPEIYFNRVVWMTIRASASVYCEPEEAVQLDSMSCDWDPFAETSSNFVGAYYQWTCPAQNQNVFNVQEENVPVLDQQAFYPQIFTSSKFNAKRSFFSTQTTGTSSIQLISSTLQEPQIMPEGYGLSFVSGPKFLDCVHVNRITLGL